MTPRCIGLANAEAQRDFFFQSSVGEIKIPASVQRVHEALIALIA